MRRVKEISSDLDELNKKIDKWANDIDNIINDYAQYKIDKYGNGSQEHKDYINSFLEEGYDGFNKEHLIKTA